jgi:neuropeptide Y receptor
VPLAALFVCLYAVVFILGLFGNSLVVFVVARNRSMQTATNLFIGNLAAADVMMCVLAVPFTPLSGLLRSWPFGEALCHIVPMTLGVSVYVSTLTSTAIAVNRYFVIIRPFQQRPSTAVCLLLVAAICRDVARHGALGAMAPPF